jgi:hypothetical protein
MPLKIMFASKESSVVVLSPTKPFYQEGTKIPEIKNFFSSFFTNLQTTSS